MPKLEELQAVFVDALRLPPDTDFPTLAYRSVPQWDSVAHMALIARIEATFDLFLDTDDVIDMSSFDACRRILGKHGLRFDG